MEVLAWASVVGRSFSFRVLTARCPLPDERVLDVLDPGTAECETVTRVD